MSLKIQKKCNQYFPRFFPVVVVPLFPVSCLFQLLLSFRLQLLFFFKRRHVPRDSSGIVGFRTGLRVWKVMEKILKNEISHPF